MSSKASLLLVIPGFAKDESDTVCIPFAQSFIKELNKHHRETEVTILALDYPFSNTEYIWHGNKVIPLNAAKYIKAFRLVKWLKLYRKIRSIHKEKNLIGILAFWLDEHAMVSHYFCKWNNIKHYCWLQGQDAKRNNKILKYFKPPAQEVIALSDFLQSEFKKNYGIEALNVISSAIDPEEFDHSATKKNIDVLGVGSLIPLKQFDCFIEVINIINQHIPVNAAIIGEGPEKSNLSALIKNKDLDKEIRVLGQLPRPHVLQKMSKAKILLHTSSYEGYGLVCLEALYAGCKVISFVKPENKAIKNWHTVSSVEEMAELAIHFLKVDNDLYEPVLVHDIKDTANAIMRLYRQ